MEGLTFPLGGGRGRGEEEGGGRKREEEGGGRRREAGEGGREHLPPPNKGRGRGLQSSSL